MPSATRHCKDGRRRSSYEHIGFTFLGYTFRPRGVRTKTGKMVTGFNPAISRGNYSEVPWRACRGAT